MSISRLIYCFDFSAVTKQSLVYLYMPSGSALTGTPTGMALLTVTCWVTRRDTTISGEGHGEKPSARATYSPGSSMQWDRCDK